MQRGGRGLSRRTSVNVPAPIWQALQALAKQRDRTTVAELCQAVAFWHFVAEERAKGNRIQLRRVAEQETCEILFDAF
jgi:predicted transcriptional regulator